MYVSVPDPPGVLPLDHQERDGIFCYEIASVSEGLQLTRRFTQVHFHVIPKPDEQQGLGISWPQQKVDMDELKQLHEQLKSKM